MRTEQRVLKKGCSEKDRNDLVQVIVLLLVWTLAAIWVKGELSAQSPAYQIMDAEDRQVYSLDVKDGLFQGTVTDLHKDSLGFLWIGTREGFNPYDGHGFKVYRHKERDSTALYGNYVYGIIEDAHGDLWVDTELCLNRYRRSSDLFSYYFPGGESVAAEPNATLPIYADSSFIWYLSADEEQGLWRLDTSDLKVERVSAGSELSGPELRLAPDGNGNWRLLTEREGLWQFSPATGTWWSAWAKYRDCPICPQPGRNSDLIVDDQGIVWLSRPPSGFEKIIPWPKAFQSYYPDDQTHPFSRENSVPALEESGNGYIWTWLEDSRGALFDPLGGRFRNQNAFVDSMPAPGFFPVLAEDSGGRMWGGTGRGLYYYHPNERRWIRSLPASDALEEGHPVGDLPEVAEPLLLVAVSDGIYALHTVNYDSRRSVEPGENPVQALVLGENREMMAANDQMVWNSFVRRLHIQIIAIWWERWWACLLFLLPAGGIAFFFYRFRLKQREAREEAQRLRTLDEIKNRFLTHITHAFRTPLTLITTPVSRALKEQRALDKEELRLIYEHSEQLKYFIDDLLDLRNIEAAMLEPSYIYGDMVSYVQYIVDAFQGQAAAKNIDLEFQAGQDYLLMNYDRKKILQILSHLLSNAVKYSPEKERVLVSLTREDNRMRLQVSDCGPGISPEILPHIFQKFYHSDHEQYGGTGIGLAIVRELTQLMEGKIRVDSRPGQGTCFTIKLPIRKGEHLAEEETTDFSLPVFSSPVSQETARSGGSTTGEKILLIEDNAAVRRLVAYCLRDRYSLEYAAGGPEGLEKAFAQIPDLVLCDIMMPAMNGYEVCRRIKEDERTSHIPVILLTALGDADSRVKGLAAGADAYLAKPFDDRELQEQIRQLLLQRKHLQSVFQRPTAVTVETATKPEKVQDEDPFLLSLKKRVENELANPDFSVPKLCRELGMSHTQLHRKLKATTGLSAIQLIQSIRMERAKTLLEDTDLTIREIAYQTGYNDPSYFGRVFAKYTGKPPTTYREEMF